jgi:hypothetical protein
MSVALLFFALFVLIVVGVVCAIAYYIPFPPPLIWLKWVIPCVALLVGLVMIVQRAGVT